MPLYEYHCSQCGDKFEKLVRLGARDGEVTCPSCGSALVDRLVSLFGRVGGGKESTGFAASSSNCAPTGG
ncbi:MAG: zinc ribbon domain-containing protein [Chloroflexota bacterium]|nr:MAG: zinc ribbon domain-containing protein [Chloroflexota bacterium]